MSNDITALPQRMKAAALKAKSEANEWGYDTDAFHDEATPDAVIQVVEDLEASRAENKLWALEVTKRNGEIYGLEQRIAELESRTVTVKLAEDITSASAPEVSEIAAEAERLGLRGTYASYVVGWNARGKADQKTLAAAGINVEAE